MADALKQRLIGALLVLFIIIIAAFILVQNANDNVDGQQELVLPEPSATIETVDENVILSDREVLLDPHKLGDDVVAVAKEEVTVKTAVPVIIEKDKSALKKIPTESPAKVSEIKNPAAPIIKKEVKPVKEAVQVVKPVPTTNTGPQWIIQVASFGVEGNAQALQKKVKTLGYQSTIETVKTDQGKTIYRLKIGPESNKQTVDTIVSKVKQHLRLTAQVIKQ